jgi:hypothetical protein
MEGREGGREGRGGKGRWDGEREFGVCVRMAGHYRELYEVEERERVGYVLREREGRASGRDKD